MRGSDVQVDLAGELELKIKKTHKRAKEYYSAGDRPSSAKEYLRLSKLYRELVKLRPAKRGTYQKKAQKYREISQGLKEGNIKIYTDGVIPEKVPEPVGGGKEEDRKSRVEELVLAEKPDTSFKDIAGLEDVKKAIKRAIVEPFEKPELFKKYGVKAGKGILMYGPPGCGKTMMAAAAAAECNATFINLKVSDIKDKYVGESEKNVRGVFALAREYGRAIIFFDEIDAVASDRSSSGEGHEKTLVNELLAQMDGLESKGKNEALVLAATNLPWGIDTALRRSGRFDRTIFIPEPDFEARKRIFQLNMEGRYAKSIDYKKLAKATEGFAASEVAALCEEAAEIPLDVAIEKGKERPISMNDFKKALKGRKSILSSWYVRAYKKLKGSAEEEMFSELIERAEEYMKR